MEDNMHKGANSDIFHLARLNRQAQTAAEKILWDCLRNKKLNGHKFRRQHPIANYIADFFCLESKLVVEVDGEYHDHPEQKGYDRGRTYELNQMNMKVIRFTNQEINERIELVLKEIATHLDKL